MKNNKYKVYKQYPEELKIARGLIKAIKLANESFSRKIIKSREKAEIGDVHIWSDGKLHRKTPDGWEIVDEVKQKRFFGNVKLLSNPAEYVKTIFRLFPHLKKKPLLKNIAEIGGAYQNEKVKIMCSSNSIIIKIIHQDYIAIRFIRKDIDNNLYVENFKMLKRNKTLKNIGFQLLISQIHTGSKFGVKYIKGKFEKSLDFNGYYTWARYGFDGEIPKNLKTDPILSRLKFVSQLMKTKAGRDYWKKKGNTFNGFFYLEKEEENMKMLVDYLKEKEK